MKVYEYNEDFNVYQSANDRFVKQIDKDTFEIYHVTVIENNSLISVNTINFDELSMDEIDKHLDICGLKYIESKNKIVQKHDESEVVEDNQTVILFVLADKLSISGLSSNMNQFVFKDAKDLNEILLEHDIPHQFDNPTLNSI